MAPPVSYVGRLEPDCIVIAPSNSTAGRSALTTGTSRQGPGSTLGPASGPLAFEQERRLQAPTSRGRPRHLAVLVSEPVSIHVGPSGVMQLDGAFVERVQCHHRGVQRLHSARRKELPVPASMSSALTST